MNRLLTIATAALVFAATFATAATLEEAVSEDGWTVEQLIAALDLMEAKYWRDVQTAQGRTAWHGKKIREIVDTNTLTRVDVYEDGMTFTNAARVTTAAASAAKYLSTLPKAAMTNGVPVRLALARARAAMSSTTNTVAVVVRADAQ